MPKLIVCAMVISFSSFLGKLVPPWLDHLALVNIIDSTARIKLEGPHVEKQFAGLIHSKLEGSQRLAGKDMQNNVALKQRDGQYLIIAEYDAQVALHEYVNVSLNFNHEAKLKKNRSVEVLVSLNNDL